MVAPCLSSPVLTAWDCCRCQNDSSRGSRVWFANKGSGRSHPRAKGGYFHMQDTCSVAGPRLLRALTRVLARACSLGRAPCFPHTLTLVCCSTGLMLMFPGQMWQGTVKGQSLNEPLWDLPQLLTIFLQLIRQGIAALAVSLHHFLPLPFPPEPPARSAQTNQLSTKIQIGSLFLESSFSLALTPGFTGTHQHAFLSASSRSVSVLYMLNYIFIITHTPSYPDLVLTCTEKKKSVSTCMCLCTCALMKAHERELGCENFFVSVGGHLTCICLRKKYSPE